MSLLTAWNSPPLVAATGVGVLVGLPFLDAVVSSGGMSLLALQGMNTGAFLLNMMAVGIPGRLDGRQDEEMRHGNINPGKNASSTEQTGLLAENRRNNLSAYDAARKRNLVNPAGWAFAIWGPIYLGESVFVASQFFDSSVQSALPELTVPFVAANVLQSLWCASFRPDYMDGWKKYVSAAMLGGTAASLSLVHAAGNGVIGPFLIPLTMHLGWMTAATLVNTNGSVAQENKVSDTAMVGIGHASVVAAGALGCGFTLLQSAPVYGLTLAWALSAVASGIPDDNASDTIKKGSNVQQMLCRAAATGCLASALYVLLM